MLRVKWWRIFTDDVMSQIGAREQLLSPSANTAGLFLRRFGIGHGLDVHGFRA